MKFRVLINNLIHIAWTENGIIWCAKNYKGEISYHLKDELQNAEIFNVKKSLMFEEYGKN